MSLSEADYFLSLRQAVKQVDNVCSNGLSPRLLAREHGLVNCIRLNEVLKVFMPGFTHG